VTTLIQRMREELVRRNYAESTIRSYLRTVEDFRRYTQKRLDQAGPDDIRRYQVYLLEERKLDIRTAVNYVAALRFFYLRTLKRPDMKQDLPYPNAVKLRRLSALIPRPEYSGQTIHQTASAKASRKHGHEATEVGVVRSIQESKSRSVTLGTFK
jgi:integrase/recombinase XerD